MPLNDDVIADTPISFSKPGEAWVLVGPCSARPWKKKKIPLDGRHYRCAGRVFLRNGQELRADLRIQTHTFQFLEPDTTWCRVDPAWYRMSEVEFLEKLNLRHEDVFPFTWLPDVPLDQRDPGPYPMSYHSGTDTND